ncbi:MAG: hypothetical protein KDK34_18885, partial [Leptospiraceae bacterium]|nr:hypothetical protein [Leptospiraceae bacterium]
MRIDATYGLAYRLSYAVRLAGSLAFFTILLLAGHYLWAFVCLPHLILSLIWIVLFELRGPALHKHALIAVGR